MPLKVRLGLIEPHYPAVGRGRSRYPLASILCVDRMQNWFVLGKPAMGKALYAIASVRAFVHLNLGRRFVNHRARGPARLRAKTNAAKAA